jgi:hypothetical protein
VVGVKKRERAVPLGIVQRKHPFVVLLGSKQAPDMECNGTDNRVSYYQRATVVLSLRKAQQFIRHFKRRRVRRACRMKGPLTKEHGKKLLGLTDPPA